MKKMFSDRSRLVVYLENSDLEAMTKQAKEEGQTVVEWARETLVGECTYCRIDPPTKPSKKEPLSDVTKSVTFTAKELEYPAPALRSLSPVCATCEHPRHKHGGFGTACQVDNCRCGRFE